MSFCWRLSFALMLAAAILLFNIPASSAADDEWESLANGIQGQRAEFDGVGGIRVAGYVRKPSGPGPFPLVVFIHGGAPTAKPVQASTDEELTKLRAARTIRHCPISSLKAGPSIPSISAPTRATRSTHSNGTTRSSPSTRPAAGASSIPNASPCWAAATAATSSAVWSRGRRSFAPYSTHLPASI
jgi:hypothetical protein